MKKHTKNPLRINRSLSLFFKMKKAIVIGIVGVFCVGAFFAFQFYKPSSKLPSLPELSGQNLPVERAQDYPRVFTIAQNLDTPWGIAFLPDGDMLVTERKGTILLVDQDVKEAPKQIAIVNEVREEGEGGLLGIALHPLFESNNFVYLYYTYSNNGVNTLNRVVRMIYRNNTLSNEVTILDEIPGASNHNGGRIKFGPDNYLYVTTGDAQEPSLAQSRESLAGKILRITDEGEAAPNNPYDNRTFSYGHRNPQGIAWDSGGQLWSSEHGPSGGIYGRGNDEVNKIELGRNYGWPEIQGDEERVGMIRPFVHSGRNSTWAPGGIAAHNSYVYFTGLRGTGLFRVDTTNSQIEEFFDNEYGRIREVIVGPDSMLYITTSNRDGRGLPSENDDKIIRINPTKL